jgi:anti-sigma-K factor RskA
VNVKEYISSGILEAYALGAVSDQERREVECLSKIYPEIAEELRELEEGVEAYAMSQAVEPPKDLRNNIMAAIEELDSEKADNEQMPSIRPSAHKAVEEEDEELRLPPKETIAEQMKGGFIWAAAAILLLLIVSSFYREYEVQQMENHLAELQETNAVYEREVDEMVRVMQQKEEAIATLSDPDRNKIVLKGTPNYQEALASVYWDAEKGQVALDASILPKLSEDEQYQLWALVGGEPIDMGVVEKGLEKKYVQEMKTTFQADAFAITIEPKGGRKTPTLEKLIVLGEV